MKLEGVIFDMDGTLLDSMFIWDMVGEEYLRSLGICPGEHLAETIKDMSLTESAIYFQKEYGVEKSVEEIISGINGVIEDFYQNKAQLKPGAKELLEVFSAQNVKMCAATVTDKSLIEQALIRCGIRAYFTGIFACEEVGAGKDKPDIYEAALQALGTSRENTIVFEDALYAIKTAKDAGFLVAGVCDAAENNQCAVRKFTDFYVADFASFTSSYLEWLND